MSGSARFLGAAVLCSGLVVSGCGADRNDWTHDIVWDGEQFVSPGMYGTDYWVSDDGLTWDLVDGTPLLIAGEQGHKCPVAFNCDIPDENQHPEIPFHFRVPYDGVAAQGDNSLILSRTHQYLTYHDGGDGGNGDAGRWTPLSESLHLDVLAAGAAEDPCLREVLEQRRSGRDGSAEIFGASWETFAVDIVCSSGGEQTRTTVDFEEQLDAVQQGLVAQSPNELWVVSADGTRTQIEEPPMFSHDFYDGAVPGPARLVADLVSSGRSFWAITDDGVVRSRDGLNWSDTVPVPAADGEMVQRLLAVPGGHVAIVLGPTPDWHEPSSAVMVSADDGETWARLELGVGEHVVDVGAAGVLTDDRGTFMLRSKRSAVVLADVDPAYESSNVMSAIGDDRLIVGDNVRGDVVDGEYQGDVWLLQVFDLNGVLLAETRLD